MKKLHASDILHLINYILYKYSFVPSINIYIYIFSYTAEAHSWTSRT